MLLGSWGDGVCDARVCGSGAEGVQPEWSKGWRVLGLGGILHAWHGLPTPSAGGSVECHPSSISSLLGLSPWGRVNLEQAMGLAWAGPFPWCQGNPKRGWLCACAVRVDPAAEAAPALSGPWQRRSSAHQTHRAVHGMDYSLLLLPGGGRGLIG